MKEVKQLKIVTFRVTSDEYTQIERVASESDHEPNNWCRELALSCSNRGQRLTINERVLYTAISQLRFLLEHGFNLIFSRDPTEASAWAQLMTQSDQSVKQIVIELQAGPKRG